MSYFYQQSLFPYDEFVNEYDDNVRLVMVLSTLEPYLELLVKKLERERMGRRDKYPVRMLMNTFIASYVYQIAVKNELIRELRRNGSLRRVVGIGTVEGVPNSWQYSRFIGKLSENANLALLDKAFQDCVEDLRELLPGLGRHLSIDGSAVRSWCSGVKSEKTGEAEIVTQGWRLYLAGGTIRTLSVPSTA